MYFSIGSYMKNNQSKNEYFILHQDGSLLYSDKAGSFSVYLGDNWRYELLVDSASGKCIGYSSMLYQMPVSFKSILLPTYEKRSLYFVENDDLQLEQYSGCSYKPFTCKAHYDKEKNFLCIGELGSKGLSVEFADNIIATVESGVLKCLYLKLENINSIDILKCFLYVK